MHNVEFFVECAVSTMPHVNMEPGRKRDFIHAFYRLQDFCDCGFTNMRCTKEMVACSYTFLFEPAEMWDYGINPQRYQELKELFCYGQGDIYWYGNRGEDFPEAANKVCVDSGSPDWQHMVEAGRIRGLGAEPIRPVSPLEALRCAREILEDSGALCEEYCWTGYLDCFFMADACTNFPGVCPTRNFFS